MEFQSKVLMRTVCLLLDHESGAGDASAPNPDNLDGWNPMADHFYSPLNMYSLDPDDAEVILTGYSESRQHLYSLDSR